MKIKLVEATITTAKRDAKASGKRIDLSDSQALGLQVRVSPNGKCQWVLAIKDKAGVSRRFSLKKELSELSPADQRNEKKRLGLSGTFPELGIADARERARELRSEVLGGRDPIAEARRFRATRRDAKAGIGTLKALIQEYGQGPGRQTKSWPEYRRRIADVFADVLDTPLLELKRADILACADRRAKTAPQAASAAVRYLRPILKWAASRSLVALECALIETPAKPSQRRERVLSEAELRSLLNALDNKPDAYSAAMRFMLLTLARREEVCNARWRDIDLAAKTWTIPGGNTKNKREHVVPLSRQAVGCLGAAGKPNDLVFSTPQGSKLCNWDRETKRTMALMGMAEKDQRTKRFKVKADAPRWHRHDLRRTGATMLGEMGEPPHIIEAALNHVAIHSPLAATYNQARYRPQVSEALQKLADRLDTIQKPNDLGEVEGSQEAARETAAASSASA